MKGANALEDFPSESRADEPASPPNPPSSPPAADVLLVRGRRWYVLGVVGAFAVGLAGSALWLTMHRQPPVAGAHEVDGFAKSVPTMPPLFKGIETPQPEPAPPVATRESEPPPPRVAASGPPEPTREIELPRERPSRPAAAETRSTPVAPLEPEATLPAHSVTPPAAAPSLAVVPPGRGEAIVVANDKPPVETETAQIERLLDSYRRSYNALDAESVSLIWEGLDTRALRRAFDSLSSQELSFDRCDVTVQDVKAQATCAGMLSYVRRVGQSGPYRQRLSWVIDLKRADDRWVISSVEAR